MHKIYFYRNKNGRELAVEYARETLHMNKPESSTITDNPAVGRSWEEVEKELFTPEEIAASNLRVAIIGELIKARREKGISQKKLEELSGVKQPIIARMEKGSTSPQIGTVLKVLAPLGMTLAVVPIKNK